MLRSLPQEVAEGVIAAQIVQHPGRPEEIAEYVCFLAGDSASLAVGSTHVMDGGYLTH
ncbi:hypothetical protein GCM10010245_87270 [Streptomyces spectabilis]|uniref:NAD(P)-dependent dehydrogenase (Short-subunit alcohol dehydrogenase family) n=1 Tax=Streptomyces spectabilis TaxID=68270 RepID=A0A7W8B3H6_STRST|nr:NAD(P)-dependent dehydrogenase (short-subunit alcohol dehydrogenase family) [Streptomyces spectabilis]GGV55141.1 hypothetical protein GCM10010245_87270 [Streptomyces spectabilis]